jgi:hypothetical protein
MLLVVRKEKQKKIWKSRAVKKQSGSRGRKARCKRGSTATAKEGPTTETHFAKSSQHTPATRSISTTRHPSFYCTSESKSIAVAAAHTNLRNLSSDPTRQNTQLKWVTQTSRPASGDSSRSAVSSSSAPASTPRSSPLLSRSSTTSAYVNSSDRYPERLPTSKYTHPHKTHLRTLFTPIATCAQDEQTISKSARLTVYEIGPCRGSFLRPQGCRPPPLRLPLGSLFDPHRH